MLAVLLIVAGVVALAAAAVAFFHGAIENRQAFFALGFFAMPTVAALMSYGIPAVTS